MRKEFAFLIGCGIALSATSQKITVNIQSRPNDQLLVNGKIYNATENRSLESKVISINDLAPGQYTLQLIPPRQDNTQRIITAITTRNGYETFVTVDASGFVTVYEQPANNAGAAVMQPMTDAAFEKLLRRVRNHWRNDSREHAARTAIQNKNHVFTTAQVRLLLESFEGEAGRLELARQVYPRTSDKINFNTLNTLFSIEDNQDALAAFIRRQNGDVVASYSESFRTPMIEQNFNSILESIEMQWQEGARLSTIIDVFNNTTYYFTTAQAKEIISLVADESSRAHLAKAVYSRLTDPENFATLYTLFEQPHYVDNLRSYISANANNMIGVHNYGKSAVDQQRFTQIYQDAKTRIRTKKRLEEIGNAFENTELYFTSYQVRSLLQLVNSETERLALAKKAYAQVVDADHFMTQLQDLFQWQANRDQLQQFVDQYQIK